MIVACMQLLALQHWPRMTKKQVRYSYDCSATACTKFRTLISADHTMNCMKRTVSDQCRWWICVTQESRHAADRTHISS